MYVHTYTLVVLDAVTYIFIKNVKVQTGPRFSRFLFQYFSMVPMRRRKTYDSESYSITIEFCIILF